MDPLPLCLDSRTITLTSAERVVRLPVLMSAPHSHRRPKHKLQ